MADDGRIKGAAQSTAPRPVWSMAGVRTAASTLQRTTAPPTAPERDHEGSLDGGGTLRSAKDDAAGILSVTAEKMKAQFEDGVDMVRDSFAKVGDQGGDAVSKAKSSLSDVLEKQPRAWRHGLAIGAAVAGAFRTTAIENEYVGRPAML